MGTAIHILIVYVTAGVGHKRAAEAIAEAALQEFPDANIECIDLLSYCPSFLRRGYPKTYEWLVRNIPSLWALCYYLLDTSFFSLVWQPLRRTWNILMARSFSHAICALKPDTIITTHFFPADVLSSLKKSGKIDSHISVVITDLHPHRFWIARYVDSFIVATEQTKRVCMVRGIAENKLHVLGIPIGTQFSKSYERSGLISTFGLEHSRKTILIASGGMGVGPIKWLVQSFIALEGSGPGRLQLLVVCGNNSKLASELEQVAGSSKMPVKIFGFTKMMHQLMAASDIMLTKPGGLSVSEALAMSLPMVFFGMIPGQERLNALYTTHSGAGLIAKDKNDAFNLVLEIINDPVRLETMRQKAKSIGRPDAAIRLLEVAV